MSRYTKLRISYECMYSQHPKCQGYDNRRVGRQFRCQCACHKHAKKS